MFESSTYEQLIIEFEECLSEIEDKNKIPHYTLIFFLTLTSTALDNIEDIAIALQDKKCYKYLIAGLIMLVSGKSKTLKFDIRLTHESFSNKYEFINRFACELPYWEHCALIFLMKTIYLIDENKFFEILMQEKSNFLCVIFFSERENIVFSKSILIEFLNCVDEIKANAILYKLMLDFNKAYRKYESNQCLESNIKLLNEVCVDISEIFISLSVEKKISLTLNLIMVEDIYPPNFISILISNSSELIKQLDLIEIRQVKQLSQLLPLITVDDQIISSFGKKMIIRKLESFLNENRGIYEDSIFINVLNALSIYELDDIYKYIESLINGLKLSEFDLQVRFIAYSIDNGYKESLLKNQKQIKDIIVSKSELV